MKTSMHACALLMGAMVAGLAPAPCGAQRTLDVKDAGAGEKRVALVIGNATYKSSPLKNPVNDARAIADRLQRMGFTVVKRENLRTKEIGSALREFRSRLSPGAVALFFYAGHGMQVRGANYLPAIDAEIEAEEDVPNQSMNVAQVLEVMEDSKARVNLVFLDACRDNPFARKFRSGSRGLARMDTTASGILIAFATRPGSVAADGEGKNGLYTEHLLRHMETPGLPIEQVLKRVGADVKLASKGRQEPWSEGLIEGDFFFRPGAALAAPAAAPGPPSHATQVVAVARPTGSLSISARSPGVDIWLNDGKVGEGGSNVDLLISNLEEGSHRVMARKGRRTWEQTVHVAANDRQHVNVYVDAATPGLNADLLAEVLGVLEQNYYIAPDYARFFAGALEGLKKAAPQGALTVSATASGVALAYTTPAKSAARVVFEPPSRTELAYEIQVAARIARDAIPSLDPAKVEADVLRGALNALDVHSDFLDADAFRELQAGAQGTFGGVGLEVGIGADRQLQVVTPIEGTPAQRAGLLPKDIVVTIDGQPTKDVALSESVKRLRGLPTTLVRLDVLREGWAQPREFQIRREIIRVVSVRNRMLEPGIAYISVRMLQDPTPDAFQAALDQSVSSGARGLVLDLRSCPGGLLNRSVQVASRFAEPGQTVVSTSGRHREATLTLKTERVRGIANMPVVVLVNEGTASGCEIIASALQDWKVATVVGNRSFGKGTVQTILPLKNGAALKLTTAEYRTPLGRRIHEAGVEPDILEPMPIELIADPAKDRQLERAVAHLKGKIR